LHGTKVKNENSIASIYLISNYALEKPEGFISIAPSFNWGCMIIIDKL
jgi:hypothetical protein